MTLREEIALRARATRTSNEAARLGLLLEEQGDELLWGMAWFLDGVPLPFRAAPGKPASPGLLGATASWFRQERASRKRQVRVQ